MYIQILFWSLRQTSLAMNGKRLHAMYSASGLGAQPRRADVDTNARTFATEFNFCLFGFAMLAPTLCVLPAIHTGANILCALNIYFREVPLFYMYIYIVF